MYGTVEKQSFNKIKNDITDAYNKDKSYIEENRIEKVVCCFTSNNINIGHIQKFYNMVTEKHKSVARLSKAVIKTLFDFAKEKSLIEVNPTEGISLPKSIEKINTKVLNINMEKTLSIEQVRLLIDKSKNTPIYLHILFAVLMGLRKQEINGLKYKDIDFVNRKLYLQRQLGVDPSKSKDKCKKKTYTKQEIPLKSYSSERILDIPE